MNKAALFTFMLFILFGLKTNNPLYGENEASFEQPLLITSAGQSAEVQLASVLAKRAGLNSILSKTATAADLQEVKTLALVIGASLKGLGAAGLDIAQEKERVSSLIQAAQNKGIRIIGLHLGGEQRRGDQSDIFIKEFMTFAELVIVVKSGNKDGLFNSLCESKGIPLVEVERTADALEPLQNAFK
jgi:hypothetical protein